jgi:hypothetical protein
VRGEEFCAAQFEEIAPMVGRTSAAPCRISLRALMRQNLESGNVISQPCHSAGSSPRTLGATEDGLAAALLAARRGDPVKIEAVSNPADPDDALSSSGALLPGPHATLAGPTFAEWLDATL